MTTTARNNKRQEVVFVGDDGTTHADRVFGSGFGAFVKMVDRASVGCTGWSTRETRVEFDNETDRVTFVNRTTGERRGFSTMVTQ